MKPISKKIRTTKQVYFQQDTKEDIRTLAEYCNMLADNINKLNEEVQELREKIEPAEDDCK